MAASTIPVLPFAAVAGRVQRVMAEPTRRNPHQVILGRSRTGKDYLVRYGLLPLLYPVARVVVFAPKSGEDDTWDGWGQDVMADELPPDLIRTDGESDPFWRVRIRPGSLEARAKQGRGLLDLLAELGSVVLVLSDAGHITEHLSRGGMGLGGVVARVMSEGASNRLQVIACVNSTAWSESGLKTQAETMWVGATKGMAERKAFADIAGIPNYARPELERLPSRKFMYSDDHDGGGDNAMLAITGV